jgi:hypothetical protein
MFFQTLAPFHQTTKRHIPEDNNLHRWYIFENRVPRRIFGREREGVTGGCIY